MEKDYEVTTTAQVERTFIVKGENDEQAHDRLRIYLKDSGVLREGLVIEQPERDKDTTNRKITNVKPLPAAKTPTTPAP